MSNSITTPNETFGQSESTQAFAKLPKVFFDEKAPQYPQYKHLTAQHILAYTLMRDRLQLSITKQMKDENGTPFIYYDLENIASAVRCRAKKAGKLVDELDKAGLIHKVRQGLGKPNLIYVYDVLQASPSNRQFQTSPADSPDPSNGQFKTRPTDSSRSVERTVQDPSNGQSNKTDKNNTELSNTDSSIHPGAQPEEVIEGYRKEIRKNIEYDHLRRQHPYDDIDEIADLMLEVLCTQGSFMRIGGKQLYTALVKERFLKLDSSHIEYVLDCLRESTADIRNIKAYLLEMLFNAPATCGSYYRAKVNHDFHDGG